MRYVALCTSEVNCLQNWLQPSGHVAASQAITDGAKKIAAKAALNSPRSRPPEIKMKIKRNEKAKTPMPSILSLKPLTHLPGMDRHPGHYGPYRMVLGGSCRIVGDADEGCLDSCKPIEPGKESQGNPIRPIRDCWGLLGLIRAYWEDLATLP